MLSIDIAQVRPGVSERIDALMTRYGATHADTDGTWAIQNGLRAYQAGSLGTMVSILESMTGGVQSRPLMAGQALALLWSGHQAKAERLLDEHANPPRNYFWITVMQLLADVAVGLRRLDHCAFIYDELLPLRCLLGVTASGSVYFGLISRTLGVLALALDRIPEAIDLLEEAVTQPTNAAWYSTASPAADYLWEPLSARATRCPPNAAQPWPPPLAPRPNSTFSPVKPPFYAKEPCGSRAGAPAALLATVGSTSQPQSLPVAPHSRSTCRRAHRCRMEPSLPQLTRPQSSARCAARQSLAACAICCNSSPASTTRSP